MKEQHLLNTQ